MLEKFLVGVENRQSRLLSSQGSEKEAAPSRKNRRKKKSVEKCRERLQSDHQGSPNGKHCTTTKNTSYEQLRGPP